jgi:hypothetical protein
MARRGSRPTSAGASKVVAAAAKGNPGYSRTGSGSMVARVREERLPWRGMEEFLWCSSLEGYKALSNASKP